MDMALTWLQQGNCDFSSTTLKAQLWQSLSICKNKNKECIKKMYYTEINS